MSTLKLIITAYTLCGILIDTSAQWMQMQSFPSGYVTDIILSGNEIYLSQFGAGIFKSSDGTGSWQNISNGLNTVESKNITQVFASGNNLYAATHDGIYKSTNDDEQWIKKSNGITIGPGATIEYTQSIFEHNGNLFTGAWNGIYRSIDEAENWEITNVSGQGILAKNFTSHNGILFAARESINFPDGYFSTDAGTTWDPLNNISFPTITFLSEPLYLWAGTIHGVWLSTDNGNSWIHRSEGLSPDPYSSSIIRVNRNLITSLKFGGSGIFRSADDGVTWIDWAEGLPFLNSIEKLIVYEDKIIAATSDGLWQRDTSEVITALEEQNNLPHEFNLFQNYPNPFNPTTNIRYAIPPVIASGTKQSQFVSLKVYDILGIEIATLVNENRPAGNYEVNFDASDLTSGIYFCRLQTNKFSSTKKMLMVK